MAIEIGTQEQDESGHARAREITFSDRHVPVLASVLSECSHKWEEVGIMLFLPEHIIAECKNGSSNAIKFCNILQAWIRQNKKLARLSTLEIALSSSVVNMHTVGQSLREKILQIWETKRKELTISELPVPCFSQNEKIVVYDGMSTLLGVQTNGEKMPCRWTKVGEHLCDDSRFNGVTEDVLLIRDAGQGLEGKYICYNQDGTEKLLEVELDVKFSLEKAELINLYQVLQEVPNSWPPVGTSTYIELALVHNNQRDNKEFDYSVRGDMDDILESKNIIKYEDLFAMYKKGTLIIIEGHPGCGKTTLTHKLSRDWAKGLIVLKGAKLVFLIPLRILSKVSDKNLQGILNILFCSETISKKVAESLEKNDGEEACFVIDGLDEYQERDNRSNIINKLLHKSYLPLAMVIVASRPAGTAELRHIAQQRVEVLGFSKQQILKYVEEYNFKTGAGSAFSIETYLNKHINVYHMCYLPVHTAMICYIYDNYRGDIPSTETKVYELFTLLTIKRKLNRDGDQRVVMDLNKLRGSIYDSFNNICKLAFDMTVSAKQTMLQSETDVSLSDICDSKVQSLGLVTIDSAAVLLGYMDIYAFLHLTFQEFLAAYHLSTLNKQDQLQVIIDHIANINMNVVWKFFCGLVQFESSKNDILQQIMSEKFGSNLFQFQCALESQQNAVCDSSIHFHEESGGRVIVKDHIFLSIDFNAMGYTIRNTSFSVTELALENCFLNLEGIQTFIEQVGPLKLNLIKSIRYSTNDGNEQCSIMSFLIAKTRSLESLHLAGMVLNSDSIRALTAAGNIKLPSLKFLAIRMPLAYRTRPNDLQFLSFKSKMLKQVQYKYVDAHYESHRTSMLKLLEFFTCEISSLCEASNTILCNLKVNLARIPDFLNLCTVLLVNCDIVDHDLSFLPKLGISNSIETLRLDFNQISCSGANYISKFIEQSTKCRNLSVSCNRIGDEGALALSVALQHTSSLFELNLQCNDIGNKGAVAVAHAVKNFAPWFSLFMWNVKITSQGASKVLEYWPMANIKEVTEVQAQRFVSVSNPKAMARAISCCTKLSTLNLSNTTVSFEVVTTLSRGLQFLTNLQSVSFNGCHLSLSMLMMLIEALKECKKLEIIRFANIKILSLITSIELGKLAAALKHCLALRELDFCGNQFGREKIRAICCNLAEHPLRTLHLNNTKMGKDGAAELSLYLRLGNGMNCLSENEQFLAQEELNSFVIACFNQGKEEPLTHNYMTELCWCANLEVLDVGRNGIQSAGAAALAYGWKYCTSLQTLNICNNEIDSNGATVLANALKECKLLKKLIIDNNPLNAEGAVVLFSALKNCTFIRSLSCRNIQLLSSMDASSEYAEKPDCSTNLKGVLVLTSAMNYWRCFEELNISMNNIDCAIAEVIAVGLERSKIHKLDIKDNQISTVGLIALAESLKNSQLTYLDISGNIFSQAGILAINSIIKSGNIRSSDIGPSMQLVEIYLNDCKITSGNVKLLVEGLKDSTEIKCLSLENNQICSDGVVELVAGLKYLSQLELLALSGNAVGVEGSRALKDWLSCENQESTSSMNRSLTFLYHFKEIRLTDCCMGPDGALQLGEGLRFCVNLQNIFLEKNQIGSSGATGLIEKVKSCGKLHCVRLDDNEIDSNGAIELAYHLKNCGNLRILGLSCNASLNLSKLTDILSPCEIIH